MRKHLVIATRGSRLALWQAEYIKKLLEELDPALRISFNVIKTSGDAILDAPLSQIGGKGLFVKEIEEAILAGRADLAVHSVKDVPMQLPDGLILGCVPKRATPTDCFVSNSFACLDELPIGAHIGTSSLRRQAQLLAKRPDLRISSLRGNIDTRLNKLAENKYDGIILATAGLIRLGLHAPHVFPLPLDDFLPAVGQGALGIECQEDNYDLLVLLSSLEDRATRVCVDAERSFLAKLDGGCQVPIAAHAKMLDDEILSIAGLVGELDGSALLKAQKCGDASTSRELGQSLGQELLAGGAKTILDKLYAKN